MRWPVGLYVVAVTALVALVVGLEDFLVTVAQSSTVSISTVLLAAAAFSLDTKCVVLAGLYL